MFIVSAYFLFSILNLIFYTLTLYVNSISTANMWVIKDILTINKILQKFNLEISLNADMIINLKTGTKIKLPFRNIITFRSMLLSSKFFKFVLVASVIGPIGFFLTIKEIAENLKYISYLENNWKNNMRPYYSTFKNNFSRLKIDIAQLDKIPELAADKKLMLRAVLVYLMQLHFYRQKGIELFIWDLEVLSKELEPCLEQLAS